MMKKLLILTVVISAIGFSQIRYNYGTFRDSLIVYPGYLKVNNIEAKSGDMVALWDTTRATVTLGVGSSTRPIDSTLTVFLPGSATEYGGVHARGIALSGMIQLTRPVGVSNSYSISPDSTGTSMIFQSQVSGGNAIYEFWPKDGDGTDIASIRLFGKGDPETFTNLEYLSIFYNPASPSFAFSTAAEGTGLKRPFLFTTAGTGTHDFAMDTSGNFVMRTLTASRLLATNASKIVVSTITLANLASSVSDVTGTTGTGKLVLDGTPTLVTPNIGAATGTSVNLTSTGTFGGDVLGGGITTAISGVFGTGSFEASSQSNVSAFTATRFSADAGGAVIELLKSRHAIIGSNTIVQSGDRLGSIAFTGANGTTYTQAAVIAVEIDGTPGATTDMPGRLLFLVTPDASGTPAEAMRISQDKAVLMAGSLTVTGAVSPGGTTTQGGVGVPAVNDTVSWTAQAASISAQNFANTTTGKLYEVTFYCHTTTTGTGTVTLSLGWNDGAAKTFTSATAALTATNNTGMVYGTEVIYVASGTPTWSTTVAGGGSTEQYAVRVALKRLW